MGEIQTRFWLAARYAELRGDRSYWLLDLAGWYVRKGQLVLAGISLSAFCEGREFYGLDHEVVRGLHNELRALEELDPWGTEVAVG